MRKLLILSVSLLLMGSCMAQPKKGKPKLDSIPKSEPLIFRDSIVVKADTTRVRVATYEKDGKYIGFQNGFVINKKYKLQNSGADIENVTYFFSEKWVAIKPQDIFDVKQYKW